MAKVKKRASTSSKKDAVASPVVQKIISPNSVPTNPKPLAAYILGNNSFTVRLWQLLYWIWCGELDTDNGVPFALEELNQAVLDLADEIPSSVIIDKLNEMCEGIIEITFGEMSVPETFANNPSFWSKYVPENKIWQNLVSLAELPSLRITSGNHGFG